MPPHDPQYRDRGFPDTDLGCMHMSAMTRGTTRIIPRMLKKVCAMIVFLSFSW